MKITKKELRQIIKEEMENAIESKQIESMKEAFKELVGRELSDEEVKSFQDGEKVEDVSVTIYGDKVEMEKDENKVEIFFGGKYGGTKKWYKNGKEHRDGDEPAVIWADGSKEWYKDGYGHRDGGKPAFIGSDGSKQWWVNGRRTRTQK